MSLRFLLLFAIPLILIAFCCRPVYGLEVNELPPNELESLAQQGNMEAQYNLALSYYLGKCGVVKDVNLAAFWFQKAAELGFTEAEFIMGVLADKGIGVQKSVPKSIEWYKKAIAKNHTKAQFNLGLILYEGFGVTKDPTQAVDLFQKAAQQGEPQAQYRLGLAYLEGKGIPKNESLAREWFEKAASNGNEDANRYLNLQKKESF
jgi:uncharacterized protein